MTARWLVPAVTTILVLVLLGAPLQNAEGKACNTSAIAALDPSYLDGDAGGYPDDPTSCHRAAVPRGALAAVVAVAGSVGTIWAFRRSARRLARS